MQGRWLNVMEIEQIKKMYNEGKSYDEICNEIGMSYPSLCKHIRTMIELGSLKRRPRLRGQRTHNKIKELEYKPKPKPVKPKEKRHKRCELYKSCVYGIGNNNAGEFSYRCNYVAITGHSRIVKCGLDCDKCTEYIKIDKDHPRLREKKAYGEDGTNER